MIVDKFWTIYRVESATAGLTYDSKVDALEVAEEFARKHPGEMLIVLEAMRAYRATAPVTGVDCTAP